MRKRCTDGWQDAATAKLSDFSCFQPLPQLVRHGERERIGLAAQRGDDLVELLVRAEIEIEKEQLSPLQFTAASPAAGKPLLADCIAEPRPDRGPAPASLPCASQLLQITGLRDRRGDYSRLHYS